MRKLSRRAALMAPFLAGIMSRIPAFAQSRHDDTEWRYYAGDLGNMRYSPLDQIDAGNFNDLQVAWRFKTDSLGARPEYQFESTPLLIKGRLYTTAGSRRDVVALDAKTGELVWMHREDEGERGASAPRQLSGHGVSYWTDGKEERILYVTPGYRLIALDARTGVPVRGFGAAGVVDLRKNDDQAMDLVHADIGLHSTPVVVKNVVIVGAAHESGNVPRTRKNAKGYVRGFDVRTGRRLWIFHTIPRKGEFGYDSWTVPGQAEQIGNTGVWAQISVDEELGLAYLGVELPTGDYSGQYRAGPALFGESIVAVDVQTGRRKWHYQTIHHGLWDRDIPCAAILCDIPHDGKIVKALAQPSKQAFLYVLNRQTGEPIWPIPETPVPQGDVPGEWYSPTQPIPSKPPGYDNQGVTPESLINFTPELHAEALEIIKNYRIGPVYTPPTMSTADGTAGTLTSPGSDGGSDWPGGAYDPQTHMVFVYSQTTVSVNGIIKNPGQDLTDSDFDYVHGMAGTIPRQNPPMGSSSRGTAPVARPRAGEDRSVAAGARAVRNLSLSVQGLPLLKPPYGRITAIDLTKGEIAWQIAHGETPDNIKNHPALKNLKIPRTGRPGILGPLSTKTLVICGESGFFTTPSGARGAMLRAYDKATGEERGAVYMPAPQSGSPMTYMLGGQQYLVVAIGGGNYSGELVAYRLPRA
jgi:quinoprotein glucose dehydrogenase